MKLYTKVNGHRVYLLNNSAYEIQYTNGLVGIYSTWRETIQALASYQIRNREVA